MQYFCFITSIRFYSIIIKNPTRVFGALFKIKNSIDKVLFNCTNLKYFLF